MYRKLLLVSMLLLSGCGQNPEEGLAACAPIVEREFAQLKRESPLPITSESAPAYKAAMTKECMARMGIYFNREKFRATYPYLHNLDINKAQEIEHQAYMRAEFYL